MKILEYCRVVKEMAEGLSDIKKKLNDSSEQIRENLMQVFLWRDSTAVDHWVSELYASCHSVPLCKNNHKYPKYSIILQEIWGCWEDAYYNKLHKYILQLEYKEGSTSPEFDKDSLYEFIKSYCEWLSSVLSTEGLVTLPEVRAEVNELLQKHYR